MAISFTSEKGVEAEVNGEKVLFFSPSLLIAAKIRKMAKPMAKALAVLFGGIGQENAARRVVKKTTNGEGGVQEEDRQEADAIDPKVIEAKLGARGQAIEAMIEQIGDERNLEVLAELCMDSAMDEFKGFRALKGDAREKFVKDFLAKVDVATICQMLKGLALANTGDLGPQFRQLAAMFKIGPSELAGAVVEGQPQDEPAPSEPAPQ